LETDVAGELTEAARRQLADHILDRALGVRRGENLVVETWTAMLPLAEEIVLGARRRAARAVLLYEDDATFWRAVEEAGSEELGRVGSHEWALLSATNAYVYLTGPSDSERVKRLSSADQAKLFAYDNEWFRVTEKAGTRRVRLDLGTTSAAAAREYGIDLATWRREIVEATLVGPDELERTGAHAEKVLAKGRRVTITHPNGTHLTLGLRGRAPTLHDGRVDARDVARGNGYEPLPSGWVVVALDEKVAEGTIRSNVAGVVTAGTSSPGPEPHRVGPIRGGVWEFRGGKLEGFEFAQGDAAFRRLYRASAPGKERPGSLTIGLNPRIRTIPSMEDQHRGRVTLSIGRNAHLGGATRGTLFFGYLYLDGATVEVDGRPLVDAGELVA
jgi:leucyl aminopeptidase (aminopeptidase T)